MIFDLDVREALPCVIIVRRVIIDEGSQWRIESLIE